MKPTLLSFFALVCLACPLTSEATTIITGLSVTGPLSDPMVSVTGGGFGTEPAPVVLGFSGYTGYDYGQALWFTDFGPASFNAGESNTATDRDFIGLNIATYTDTSIVFTLGSDYSLYYYPNNIYAIHPGDSFEIHVNGVDFSTTPAATPEPASLSLLATAAALAGGSYLVRRRIPTA